MTSEQQKQQGFNSARRQMATLHHHGSAKQEYEAHRMWNMLGNADSAYSNGCRQALRVYFNKQRPNRRMLAAIGQQERREHGMISL